jgi:hypothetical protein
VAIEGRTLGVKVAASARLPSSAAGSKACNTRPLGLVPPWMVAAANFDAEKKRLDIEIDFKVGGRFCPDCGQADCPVHDTVKKTWRHLNFFQHEAFLHARVARIDCSPGGTRDPVHVLHGLCRPAGPVPGNACRAEASNRRCSSRRDVRSHRT